MVVGIPEVHLSIAQVFEFQHGKRQPIDKDHNVRPARLLRARHGELARHQEVIGPPVVEVDDSHILHHLLVPLSKLHTHAIQQQLVEGPVLLDERGMIQSADDVGRVVDGLCGDLRVQPRHRSYQPLLQHYLVVACSLGDGRIRRHIGTVQVAPASVLKPFQAERFELGFSGHDRRLEFVTSFSNVDGKIEIPLNELVASSGARVSRIPKWVNI